VILLTSGDTPLTPAGPGLPAVTTNPVVTNISFNAATGGGDVTNTGGSAITARGICWGTASNPTVAGAHTVEPGTLGPFISNMTGLLPSTTYHMRAYATNTTGTAYGADVAFSTLCEVIAPLPDFAANKVNISVGESVNFFDSTKFCPESWNWTFNGGIPATSTLQNPTGITFNFAGDYTICLTATNQWGQQTTCKAAYIHVIGPTNAPIVMTELNYRSPLGGTDSLEFIELYNNGSEDINLQNFYFSKGIEFTFPAVTLSPQSYVMVCKSAAFMTNYFNVSAYQWNAGSALSNGGEPVVLKDRYGYVVDSLSFLPVMPWDTMANGRGPTLELCDPNANNAIGSNWRHAIEYQAKTPAGDSIWASPLEGCSYLPVAGFLTSDSTINLGQSVVFTDVSTGQIDSWFWEFERGVPETYSGQTPPPVTYNILGAYDVTLTVRNNAGKSVRYKPGFIQVGPTGFANLHGTSGFTLTPNPADGGKVTLLFSTSSEREITLLTAAGTVIERNVSSSGDLTFRLGGVAKGLYFVRVTDRNTGFTNIQKLIVQ
jgi:PKD repeat protein